MDKMDYSAIVNHCSAASKDMEDAFETIRPELLEIARNCYPVAVPGLADRVDVSGENVRDESRIGDFRLLDPEPVRAHRRGAAGFHANLTPPSRQWFRFGEESPDPASQPAVDARRYLDELTAACTQTMRLCGLYKQLHVLYCHLLAFGFGCMLVAPDDETVVRPRTLRPGTYALGVGADGKVRRLVRRFSVTGPQLLEEFGRDGKIDAAVSDDIRARPSSRRWLVRNLIEPETERGARVDDFTGKMGLPDGMKWRSVYWIDDNRGDYCGILRIDGFPFCPIVAPRMDKENGDVYGAGKGHEALPQMRSLQAVAYDALTVSGNIAEPPVYASADFVDGSLNLQRGGINIASGDSGRDPILAPVFAAAGNSVEVIDYNVKSLRDAIGKSFYNDIFSAIFSLDKRDMTAAEIYERTSEALSQLGPVLTSLDDELLNPLCKAVKWYVERADGLVHAPEKPIKVRIEYISSVHLAQRASELGTIDKFMGFVGSVARVKPDAVDLVDEDHCVREYAKMTGLREDNLRAPDVVEKARAARAQAQAAERHQEQAASAAQALAKVGSVSTNGTIAGAYGNGPGGVPGALSGMMGGQQ